VLTPGYAGLMPELNTRRQGFGTALPGRCPTEAKNIEGCNRQGKETLIIIIKHTMYAITN